MQVPRNQRASIMNSKRESKTSYTNANVRLLAILLLVVAWGLQARPLSAHENTLAAYTHSLGLQAEPAPEVSTKSPRCKLTVKLIDATTKEPLPGLSDLLKRSSVEPGCRPIHDWLRLIVVPVRI